MSSTDIELTDKAFETLEHAKRVFENSRPRLDPWSRDPKPPMFASVAAKHPEAIAELVTAGYLAPAPGPCMWGFYVQGERLLKEREPSRERVAFRKVDVLRTDTSVRIEADGYLIVRAERIDFGWYFYNPDKGNEPIAWAETPDEVLDVMKEAANAIVEGEP